MTILTFDSHTEKFKHCLKDNYFTKEQEYTYKTRNKNDEDVGMKKAQKQDIIRMEEYMLIFGVLYLFLFHIVVPCSLFFAFAIFITVYAQIPSYACLDQYSKSCLGSLDQPPNHIQD